jgi:hypothetical protein
MLTAIHFNHKSCFQTHKIHDIGSQWLLTTKLEPTQLLIPQVPPQNLFGFGGSSSEIAGNIGKSPAARRVQFSPSPNPSRQGRGIGSTPPVKGGESNQPLPSREGTGSLRALQVGRSADIEATSADHLIRFTPSPLRFLSRRRPRSLQGL